MSRIYIKIGKTEVEINKIGKLQRLNHSLNLKQTKKKHY